tara:strand:+ start:91 stop:1071 length:981 start_codon:yes stop_codon:yes gene_type:complete
MIFQYLLMLYYSPYFSGECPSWVYFTLAGCVFFYQTMDAIDGKQARRTGCSSPLGELFDHGCDALTATTLAMTSLNVMQLGTTYTMLIGLACPLISFYTTQWEEHHTHRLILGYLNVTEAQLVVCIVYVLTGIFGGQFISETRFSVAGINVNVAVIIYVAAFLGALGTATNNVVTLITYYKGNTQKIFRSFLEFIPLIQVLLVLVLWPYLSKTDILHREWYYVHAFMLGCGTLIALLCGHLVVYRVVRQVFPVFHPVLLPTFIPFLLLLHPAGAALEGPFAILFGIYGLSMYFYESVRVSRQICKAFDINVFTIPEGGYPFNKKAS